MKKLLLLTLLIAPIWNVHSMKALVNTPDAAEIDTSIHELSVEKRAFVLRIVMVLALFRKDYEAATHILEKTKLHPGKFFVGYFDKGPVLGGDIKNKKRGVSYCLYKAAVAAGHKRIIALLRDEKGLAQIYVYARCFNDRDTASLVEQDPGFKEQYDEYCKETVAQRNGLLKQIGKEPLTREQWEAAQWESFHKWVSECQNQKYGF